MKKSILIYGAGHNCKLLLKFINKQDFEILGILDTYKNGEYLDEYLIRSPRDIVFYDYDEIWILAQVYEKEIEENLVKKYKVEKAKIKNTSYINQKYLLGDLKDKELVFITDDTDYLNISYKELENINKVLITTLLVYDKKMENTDCNYEFTGYIVVRSHYFLKVDLHLETIRYKYPRAKFVLLLSDMLDGNYGYLKRLKNFSVDYIKQRYDYIITYNYEEAKKYKLEFFELPYTKLNIIDEDIRQYDLFFVGNAKNRLDDIHSLYINATKIGLKCGFWINEVREEDRLQETNIIYNNRLSYLQYLKFMMRSRCIVDLCQKNDKTTLRYSEAVVYNKKLLTDDKSCIYKTLYNSNYIKILPSAIDECFFNWVRDDNTIDYGYTDEFSPVKFVEYLENLE